MPEESPFHEHRLLSTPIRDLGLQIAGTALEPVLSDFQKELERTGITRLKPHFYLSTEWGVPFDSISIAIPFYLARPELAKVHAERVGHIEGVNRSDLLRYLRHEMGHVINYAYKLYEMEDWIKRFGSMTQPYVDEYRPKPFSRRYVRHLPGWYAQKHPDEDWAETFAVWVTPRLNWRTEYADWPEALAKLNFCDQIMKELQGRDPLIAATDSDEDVSQVGSSLEDYYREQSEDEVFPPGLDGSLQAIFEDYAESMEDTPGLSFRPADELITKLKRDLVENVYRWTGHFPESTRSLLNHLVKRAREMKQVYPPESEATVTVALTALVTSLAMNHVFRGSYFS